MLTSKQEEEIRQHSIEIAKILYSDADPSQLKTLEGIEKVVRGQILEHVSPEIGIFLWKRAQEQRLEGVGS